MPLFFLLFATTTTLDTALTFDSLTTEVRKTQTEVRLATPILMRGHWRLVRALVNPEFRELGCDASVSAGIHLTETEIWVGLTIGDRRRIERAGRYDWESLAEALREYRQMPLFEGRHDIELSAGDEVSAEAIAEAIHVATGAGFSDIEYTVPGWQSLSFSEETSLVDRFPLRAVGRRSAAVAVLDSGLLVASDEGYFDLLPQRRGRDDLDGLKSLLRLYDAEVFAVFATARGSADHFPRYFAARAAALAAGLLRMPKDRFGIDSILELAESRGLVPARGD